MKDEILSNWTLSLSFTRLFTTSNAINPTRSAQNHSRKRNVSPLMAVFLAVRPHRFDTFRVSKKVETKLAADVPTRKPRKCPLNCLYAPFNRSFVVGQAIVFDLQRSWRRLPSETAQHAHLGRFLLQQPTPPPILLVYDDADEQFLHVRRAGW